MANDFCPQCNLTVTPQDPEKIKWGSITFHKPCIQKMKNRADERNEDVSLSWRGNESRIIFIPRR